MKFKQKYFLKTWNTNKEYEGEGGVRTYLKWKESAKLTYGMVLVNQRNKHEGHVFVPIPGV